MQHDISTQYRYVWPKGYNTEFRATPIQVMCLKFKRLGIQVRRGGGGGGEAWNVSYAFFLPVKWKLDTKPVPRQPSRAISSAQSVWGWMWERRDNRGWEWERTVCSADGKRACFTVRVVPQKESVGRRVLYCTNRIKGLSHRKTGVVLSSPRKRLSLFSA
jgi:hypothetical protein